MMMIVKKVQGFLTFERPVNIDLLFEKFNATHLHYKTLFPEWAVSSTKKKLIAYYWFRQVFPHYLSLIGLSSCVTLFGHTTFDAKLLMVYLTVSLLILPVLLFFNYLPCYIGEFLPNLETVMKIYVQRQEEDHLKRWEKELIAHSEFSKHQQELVQKCRKAQFGNLTLVLIYYALANLAGIEALTCDTKTAKRLEKLFGVDAGSLKQSLELILGISSKGSGFKIRKTTEIQNRINEAIDFLAHINCPEGIDILEQLEVKLFNK